MKIHPILYTAAIALPQLALGGLASASLSPGTESTKIQSAQDQGKHAATKTPAAAAKHKASPYRPGVPDSAKGYHQAIWGVDNMLVRHMASGNLIRFSYRVTDPRAPLCSATSARRRCCMHRGAARCCTFR